VAYGSRGAAGPPSAVQRLGGTLAAAPLGTVFPHGGVRPALAVATTGALLGAASG
jgi:hypothetical protein